MKLNKKAQVAMDRIVKKFQTGDLSPIVKVARLQISKDIPAANWSFSNQVIAFAQTDSIDCRGYRQWQKVGRQVQKGSKAAYIIYPKKVKAKDEDGKPVYICIGFGATAVFPRHTTTVIEGQEDLDINYEPTQLPPLYDVAIKLGIQVEWIPLPPDRLGDATTDGSKIRMATHDQSTFFHELAHAAHARIDGKLKNIQDAEQETVAELTATVLMQLYGIRDHTGNAWKYISAYNTDPLKAILKAISKVGQVIELLATFD